MTRGRILSGFLCWGHIKNTLQKDSDMIRRRDDRDYRSFWDAGNVVYLDLGAGYTGVFSLWKIVKVTLTAYIFLVFFLK